MMWWNPPASLETQTQSVNPAYRDWREGGAPGPSPKPAACLLCTVMGMTSVSWMSIPCSESEG